MKVVLDASFDDRFTDRADIERAAKVALIALAEGAIEHIGPQAMVSIDTKQLAKHAKPFLMLPFLTDPPRLKFNLYP